MRVLVACERSGRVRTALRAVGVDAWSNDLHPAEDGGPHIQGDVLDILKWGWDGLIAFPDCTHHVVSGARWFHQIPKHPKPGVHYGEARYRARERDRAMVSWLWVSKIPRIAIENPVGTLGAVLGKPTQIVQPYYFGDPAIKTTCLWLKNLPPLARTSALEPPQDKQERRCWQQCWNEAPGPERRMNRARTYPGLAQAMAEQWGGYWSQLREATA